MSSYRSYPVESDEFQSLLNYGNEVEPDKNNIQNEEKLEIAMQFINQMEEKDLEELKQISNKGGDLAQAFVQRALDRMWQHKTDQKDMKFKSIMIAAASKNFLQAFAIPSLDDLIQVVRNTGKLTLKELRQVTNEKLGSKIFRQFVSDVALVLPFALFIMLQYNLALQNKCTMVLITWLIVFLGITFVFSTLKLIRIPLLLNNRSPKCYFYFTVTIWSLQATAHVCLFTWGNVLFWASIRAPQCSATATYDPILLFVLIGIVLMIGWVFIIVVAQLLIFAILLYAVYKAIVDSVKRLLSDFSVKNLIIEVLNLVGEGELQDSLTVALLMLFLDNQKVCAICKKSFNTVQKDEVRKSLTSNSSWSSIITDPQEDVVTIKCDPRHYFHAACLDQRPLCPICYP